MRTVGILSLLFHLALGSLDRCGDPSIGTCGDYAQADCEARGCCYNDVTGTCLQPQQVTLVSVYGATNNASYCHFPFVFGGEVFWTCTEADSVGQPWCATVYDYDEHPEMGYCLTEDCVLTSEGREYIGSLSVTAGGYECQSWTLSIFNMFPDNMFPDASVEEARNYCRNPSGDPLGPWCHRADAVGYDNCDIPFCDIAETYCDVSLVVSGSMEVTVSASNMAGGGNVTLEDVMLSSTGGWCSGQDVAGEFLQISFTSEHRVWGITTKAVSDGSYTTTYTLAFSPDGVNFTTYQEAGVDKVFSGSSNVTAHYFLPTYTRHVRVLPATWQTAQCALVDVTGCVDSNGCDPDPCDPTGTAECVDMTADYRCSCNPGWTGALCDTDIDECSMNICENGGTCINSPGGYSCACVVGYSGATCADGGAESCLALEQAGVTTSGDYKLTLYVGTPDASVCSFWDVDAFGPWMNVELHSTLAVADWAACKAACLAEPACEAYSYLISSHDCQLVGALRGNSKIDGREVAYSGLKQCAGPVQAYCDFSTPGLPSTTLMPRFSTPQHGQIHSVNCPDCARHVVLYSATMDQLAALTNDSITCRQPVSLLCNGVHAQEITLHMADGTSFGLDEQITYAPPDNPDCACFTGVCSSDECLCNGVWWYGLQTEGTNITSRHLPVTYYQFGPLQRYFRMTIGEVTCTQSVADIDECASSPCAAGSTCLDGHYFYTCTCVAGFTGYNCDVDIDDCASAPCQNGGDCVDLLDGYNCLCLDGYQGTHCENDVNECVSSPCFNDGSCVDLVDMWSCVCRPGYVGETCSIDMDECFSAPCQQAAPCTNLEGAFSCDCPDGYTGNVCQTDIDECESSPCENGSDCIDLVNYYVCDCRTGFSGYNCEINEDECVSGPCLNGGVCMDGDYDFNCTCAEGFTGPTCAVNIDECASGPCQEGGICVDDDAGYACQCLSGHEGDNCEIAIDLCLSAPCENGGFCASADSGGGIVCECQPGYSGDFCQIDVNECASEPCINGGQCEDGVNEYTCTCPVGFVGSNCQYVRVDGEWGGWAEWTACNVQCGTGVRTSTRQCNNPVPQHGGQTCDGQRSRVELCYSEECTNVDGAWSLWGEWGRCSATCNTGVRTRRRECDNPAPRGTGLPCPGGDTSTAYCTDRACGEAVDGRFSLWSAWSACSVTCGLGVSTRSRSCSDPPAVYGGKPCVGPTADAQPCLPGQCPKYSACAEWGAWTACSATCGDGMHSRARTCQHNGAAAAGDVTTPSGGDDGSEAVSGLQVVEYEYEHCEQTPCGVQECYFCNSTYDGSVESLACRGPTKPCPAEQPYCIYAFDTGSPSPGLSKGCASFDTCSENVTEKCAKLWDETISAIVSERADVSGPLEPHPDTLAQMWHDLDGGRCHVCCTKSRCNRGRLPPGNTVFSSSPASSSPRLVVLLAAAVGAGLLHWK